MTADKRRNNRIAVDVATAVFQLHSGEHFGYLVNITAQGLMLSCPFAIDANCVYQLRFVVPQEADPVELGVESLWTEQSLEQNLYWTGFRIIDISNENQAKLNRFIDQLS